ncbi:MAG TPA: replicative DNA helicase [Flavobacteriales bacterium]|nr:replicative DNA helicase [Flavobacteriales bacterium]
MKENTPQTNSDRKKRIYTGVNVNPYDAGIGKLPPQAVDVEEAVLGALMLDRDSLANVIDSLKPETFYRDEHQRIFGAIFELFASSKPVDMLTVVQELKKRGELDMVGGVPYITSLTNRVASTANIEYHTRILNQKQIQRELIRVSSDIIKDAYEESTDALELLDKAEKNLFAVAEGNIKKNFSKMSELITEAKKQIEKAGQQQDGLSGIPSGFLALDRFTAGWQKSDLVILAARPGMGKTAFVLSLARNAAVDYKRPIAVFSLEMSSVQLVMRLISGEAELPGEKLKKGDLQQHEWHQLDSKIRELTEAPLFIDDTPALSIFELRAKARRLKANHDIQMIIIDYLQLMTAGGDNRGGGNREQEISQISRSLKGIAKELEIPVIALSQLSRNVEQRGGTKVPQLSDLRESGAIEQDADMVMFIYRPEYYNITENEDGSPTNGLAEIHIAKHRNGALGVVPLKYIGHLAKFTDMEGTHSLNPNMRPSGLMPNVNFDSSVQETITVGSKMNSASGNKDNWDPDNVPF